MFNKEQLQRFSIRKLTVGTPIRFMPIQEMLQMVKVLPKITILKRVTLLSKTMLNLSIMVVQR